MSAKSTNAAGMDPGLGYAKPGSGLELELGISGTYQPIPELKPAPYPRIATISAIRSTSLTPRNRPRSKISSAYSR